MVKGDLIFNSDANEDRQSVWHSVMPFGAHGDHPLIGVPLLTGTSGY